MVVFFTFALRNYKCILPLCSFINRSCILCNIVQDARMIRTSRPNGNCIVGHLLNSIAPLPTKGKNVVSVSRRLILDTHPKRVANVVIRLITIDVLKVCSPVVNSYCLHEDLNVAKNIRDKYPTTSLAPLDRLLKSRSQSISLSSQASA